MSFFYVPGGIKINQPHFILRLATYSLVKILLIQSNNSWPQHIQDKVRNIFRIVISLRQKVGHTVTSDWSTHL